MGSGRVGAQRCKRPSAFEKSKRSSCGMYQRCIPAGNNLASQRAGHEVRQGQGRTIVTIQVPAGPRRLWCHIIRRYAVHRLKAIDSQRSPDGWKSFNLQLVVARIGCS